MITEKEIMDKLYEMPAMFHHHVINKEWAAAKAYYNNAQVLCTVLKLDDRIKIELFGNRPYADDGEEITDGLFREDEVLKMLDECCTMEEREIKLMRMRMEVNRRKNVKK